MLSGLFGKNRETFFPKLSQELDLLTFSDIAVRFLNAQGYETVLCKTEAEARELSIKPIKKREWPCYFFKSDTTGEKDYEEFYNGTEKLDFARFKGIGVISNALEYDSDILDNFEKKLAIMRESGRWSKEEIIEIYKMTVPEFNHKETGKFLDQRM